jgi:hypothetical protein
VVIDGEMQRRRESRLAAGLVRPAVFIKQHQLRRFKAPKTASTGCDQDKPRPIATAHRGIIASGISPLG